MQSLRLFGKMFNCFLTQIPDQPIKWQQVVCGKDDLLTFKASVRKVIKVNLNVVNMAVGAKRAGVIHKRLIYWDFHTGMTILRISTEWPQKRKKKTQ